MTRVKTLLIAAVFIVLGTYAFAEDATVTFVSGKVEVQRNGAWVALQKGDTVGKSETISTGFQSEAKIQILDSVMYLGPVTRITLEELSSSGKQDNVNVYLKTGTARSQVKHVDNKRVNYQVHTAVAVASCLGTDWILDDSNTVDGIGGTIAVSVYVAPEENEEAEGEGEEKKQEETEAAADEELENTEESDEESEVADTLTGDDGILVKADQTVSVSEYGGVSNPVNNTVKAANDIKSAVSSAATKGAVGGDPMGSGDVGSNGGAGADSYRKDKDNSGTIVVTLEFPE